MKQAFRQTFNHSGFHVFSYLQRDDGWWKELAQNFVFAWWFIHVIVYQARVEEQITKDREFPQAGYQLSERSHNDEWNTALRLKIKS
jgi:hypothetical protein